MNSEYYGIFIDRISKYLYLQVISCVRKIFVGNALEYSLQSSMFARFGTNFQNTKNSWKGYIFFKWSGNKKNVSGTKMDNLQR